MMKKYFLLFCTLVTFVAACTHKKETTGQGPLQELKLGAMSSMDYIPFVIAQKTGIYDSLGLKLDLVKFFSANDRDAAFQSGNIDGTVIDFTGAAIQQANGVDLAMIMKNDGIFYLIAAKGSGIDAPDGLKNKNIAVSRNTVIEFSTDKALEAAGISTQEVNKPEINKIPLRLEMLQSGQIDASIFPDPFATIALDNGHKSLITTKDLGISVTGTMFTGKALKEKSEEIKALIEGYNLAVAYLKSHPVKEWASVLVEDAGVPYSLVDEIILPDYRPAALPTEKDITTTIQWLKSKKLIPADYSGKTLVDTTFVRPALKSEK